MKYLTIMLSVIAVLLLAPVVTAQDNAPPAREKLVNNSAIPDGAVFYHMVAMYQAFEDQGLRGDAVQEIAARLKVDGGAAEATFNTFLDAFAEINSEYELARAAHSCSPGNPYDIIEQFDGIHEAIAEASFEKTLAGLDQPTANRLINWLAESKYRTTYIREDVRESDRQSGRDSTANLRANCQGH